jgi:uncharacterized protein YcfL
MNKLYLLIIPLLILGSCNKAKWEIIEEHNQALIDSYFRDTHKLLSIEINDKKIKESHSGGVFLLCLGGYGSDSHEEVIKTCTFYWQNHGGEYLFTEMPMTSVRIIIDDKVSEPYCTFNWHYSGVDQSNYGWDDQCWKNCINYAVITLRRNQILTSTTIKL